MFNVERLDNGYILVAGEDKMFFPSEKKLVAGIREILGLPSQGRKKGSKNIPKNKLGALDSPPF